MCDRNHGEPVLAVKLHCNAADSDKRLSILASSFSFFLFCFLFVFVLSGTSLPDLHLEQEVTLQCPRGD